MRRYNMTDKEIAISLELGKQNYLLKQMIKYLCGKHYMDIDLVNFKGYLVAEKLMESDKDLIDLITEITK
tara:strand:- start:325 stop:534 length:210 start_codon:yes stop_codon:yes gene_type:complete